VLLRHGSHLGIGGYPLVKNTFPTEPTEDTEFKNANRQQNELVKEEQKNHYVFGYTLFYMNYSL